jgi:hypothetical protein
MSIPRIEIELYRTVALLVGLEPSPGMVAPDLGEKDGPAGSVDPGGPGRYAFRIGRRIPVKIIVARPTPSDQVGHDGGKNNSPSGPEEFAISINKTKPDTWSFHPRAARDLG